MSKNTLKINLIGESAMFTSKLLIQLFFPVLMLTFWGKELFNLWLFLFAIPSFFGIFQISIVSPIRNHMVMLFKKKKYHELDFFYQNTFFFTFFNILLISIILLFYLIYNLDNFDIAKNLNLIFVVFLIFSLNLINSNSHIALSYEGSIQKFYKIEIFFDLLINFLIPFSFLIISFESVFILVLFLTIIKSFVLFNSIKDQYLTSFVKLKFFNKVYLKKIFKLSLGFNLDIISNILKGPGMLFGLGITGNLNIITLFSTSRTLFYYFPIRLIGIIEKTFFLEYINIINFKKKLLLQYFLKIIFFTMILFIFFGIFSFFFGLKIYNIWTLDNFISNQKLIMLILLDASLTVIANLLALPLKSINKYNSIAIIELAINLILFVILLKNNFFSDLIESYKIIITSTILIFFTKLIFAIQFLKINDGVSKHIKR